MAKTIAINANSKTRKRPKRRSKKMSGRATDPPILVGGGGSTLIWVRNDFTLTQIPSAPAGAPKPGHPANYQIFEVDVNVTNSTVKVNQSGGQTKHTGMDPKKHSTEFDI